MGDVVRGIKGVAAYLNIPQWRAADMLAVGRIPAAKVGGRYVVSKKHLDAVKERDRENLAQDGRDPAHSATMDRRGPLS